jgi:receptor protein-tyrosine kinase
MTPDSHSNSADWLRPAEEQEGLKRSAETIRERIWVIVGAVAITTLIAIVYVLAATKTYEATADLLVTPVTDTDPVVTSLGLLRESSDPTRDVQTASQLIANIDVARRASRQLDQGSSPEALLSEISSEPVANSNIVSVTAKADSPERAQEVANTFAEAAVEEQTDRMHAAIEKRLPKLEEIAAESGGVEGATEGDEGSSISAQVAVLQALAGEPNPTMRVQTQATTPDGPSSPKRTLSVIAGILAGLILGIGGAFALQALDPRLRRESQLRREYRLPILARVPNVSRSDSKRPLMTESASPFVSEAYRTLRATLTTGRSRGARGRGQVILITGSSPSEGKTTSAINLAISLSMVNKTVLLIEADLRRPVIARLLDVEAADKGVVSVLIERADLDSAVIRSDTYGPNLRLLVAEPNYRGGWITELFSSPRAAALLAEARKMVDYVVIDSPPLNEVVDAMPLAEAADNICIVTRLGRSRMDKLHELGELLVENEIVPSGFVLVGTKRPLRNRNHYARRRPGSASTRRIPTRPAPAADDKPVNRAT